MQDEYEHQNFWRKEKPFNKVPDILALAAWIVFVGLALWVMLIS